MKYISKITKLLVFMLILTYSIPVSAINTQIYITNNISYDLSFKPVYYICNKSTNQCVTTSV